MRRCTRCGEEKPLDQFPPVRRGEPRLQSWCRACFAEVNAANYRKDAANVRARVAARFIAQRELVRREIIAYLRAHPCVDCGESDIVVLEFDHRGDKIADISVYASGGRTWPTVLTEIAKCDVRCANCHRKRSAERRAPRPQPLLPPVSSARDGVQLTLDAALGLRRCRVCLKTKTLSDFPFRSLDEQTRKWICLECQRSYSRAWYARNRAKQIERAATNNLAARRRAAAYIAEYLQGHPCVDCGEGDMRVLDFDHLRDKTAEVSRLVNLGATNDRLRREIAKCAVRCANCHRRKTSKERGNYRSAFVI